jgi:hypothetical protein
MKRAGVFDGVTQYETGGLGLECHVEWDAYLKVHASAPVHADIAFAITLELSDSYRAEA